MIANTIGIDLGIQCFAFLFDGGKIEPPKYLLQAEKKLQKEQRRLSRRQKGTQNWEKQVEKVQKVHTKVANQRRDFLHKQSYRTCGNHVKKSLSVRTHICPKCGLVMDRDENAALNILHRGLEKVQAIVSYSTIPYAL